MERILESEGSNLQKKLKYGDMEAKIRGDQIQKWELQFGKQKTFQCLSVGTEWVEGEDEGEGFIEGGRIATVADAPKAETLLRTATCDAPLQ